MTGRLFRLTEFLREVLNDWNNQFFNTSNIPRDMKELCYEQEGIKVLNCMGFGFEVFGLDESEFEKLKEWANYFVKRINNK